MRIGFHAPQYGCDPGRCKCDGFAFASTSVLHVPLLIDTPSTRGLGSMAMSYIAERRLEEKVRPRAEIVDAAEAAGRDVGLDALTMDDVARRARLSRALLYVYFQDRTDLMFGLAERAMTMLHGRFVEAAERNR